MCWDRDCEPQTGVLRSHPRWGRHCAPKAERCGSGRSGRDPGAAVGVTKAVGAWRSLGLITPSPPDKPPVYLCIFGLQPPTPLMRRCWRGNRGVQVAGTRVPAAPREIPGGLGASRPPRCRLPAGAGRARSRWRQRLAGRRESPEPRRAGVRPGRSAAPDPEAEPGRPPPPQAAFPEGSQRRSNAGPGTLRPPGGAQTWT